MNFSNLNPPYPKRHEAARKQIFLTREDCEYLALFVEEHPFHAQEVSDNNEFYFRGLSHIFKAFAYEMHMEENRFPNKPLNPRYNLALNLVAELELVSVSLLQRRLKIGYNAAADLILQLEANGVIVSLPNDNHLLKVIMPKLPSET